MSDEDFIQARGGFIAPSFLYDLNQPFQVTYRVQGVLRRWWFRRTGWSTEWTVEYDPSGHPVRDALPSFSALRGGISFGDSA